MSQLQEILLEYENAIEGMLDKITGDGDFDRYVEAYIGRSDCEIKISITESEDSCDQDQIVDIKLSLYTKDKETPIQMTGGSLEDLVDFIAAALVVPKLDSVLSSYEPDISCQTSAFIDDIPYYDLDDDCEQLKSNSKYDEVESKDIIIRYAMTKGDGEFPGPSDFSEDEIQDLRKCLEFALVFDPDESDAETVKDLKVLSMIFLYDGISRIEDGDEGYWFDEGGNLNGYPSPIIRFSLNRKVNQEAFLRCTWRSFFRVITKSMRDSEQEGFFAEDHNGYASIISQKELARYLTYLGQNSVYCGKGYDFKEGGVPLEAVGWLPAIEFAIPNGSND